jgi:MFS family permease
MLFLAGGLNYVDRTSISAVYPLIRADLHATNVQLGAIGSAFLWACAAGAPFAGMLADRVSRSRLIVYSLAAWSLIMTLCGFVTSVEQLVTLRVLLGFAECTYIPASMALIADHHEESTRATAMGIHLAGLNLAVVVGGTASGYLGEHFGWRFGLNLLGATGLVLSGFAWFILQDGPARATAVVRESVTVTLAELGRVPTYWIIVAEEVLASIGVWMFYNWMPLYFRETFHMSLTGAGFFGTVLLQSAAIIGISAGGVVSDRVTRGRPLRRMWMLGGFYCVAAPFLLIFLTQPGLEVLSVCIFGCSLLRTFGQVNEGPVMCDLFPPHRRAMALGLMSCCTMLAGGLGVYTAGYLKSDFGLGGVFAGVSIAILLSGSLSLIGARWTLPRDLQRVMAEQRAAAG